MSLRNIEQFQADPRWNTRPDYDFQMQQRFMNNFELDQVDFFGLPNNFHNVLMGNMASGEKENSDMRTVNELPIGQHTDEPEWIDHAEEYCNSHSSNVMIVSHSYEHNYEKLIEHLKQRVRYPFNLIDKDISQNPWLEWFKPTIKVVIYDKKDSWYYPGESYCICYMSIQTYNYYMRRHLIRNYGKILKII